VPSRTRSAEFPVAYLVAFQHTIFHPVPRCNGFHNGRDFDARAVPSRKSLHSFHYRRPKTMTRKYRLRHWNDTRGIFCVFLIVRLSAFAQPDSNGNDTGTREGIDDAVNTASWETRDLPNMHLRFKLPTGYRQKQWAVVVGTPEPSATFQLGHENEIDFTVENVENANPENAKVGLQKDYVDYKEWTQLIGGHKGVVQTFQGGGVIIDEEGKRLPYRVAAICAPDAEHLLRISAMLGNQERQQEVLVMLKTIEFY